MNVKLLLSMLIFVHPATSFAQSVGGFVKVEPGEGFSLIEEYEWTELLSNGDLVERNFCACHESDLVSDVLSAVGGACVFVAEDILLATVVNYSASVVAYAADAGCVLLNPVFLPFGGLEPPSTIR